MGLLIIPGDCPAVSGGFYKICASGEEIIGDLKMCNCKDCNNKDINGYVEAVEQAQGDETLKLMLAEPQELDPQVPDAVCPKCLNDEIEFKQLNENYTGRAFYLLKCKNCGTEFILLEDQIDCCRRGIINCKQRIDYENKKIETYNNMLTNI